MNEKIEYYSRLLLWIEAMRLASRMDNFVSKLEQKEDELIAIEDPFATDFGEAAFRLADGMFLTCESLLKNAVIYGYKHLGLKPYHLSNVAIPLLIEELLQNNSHLDYYSNTLRNARKDAAAHDGHALITFEEIERNYSRKAWRRRRIRDGLGVGGDLFEQEWYNGTNGRPPLRETIPWLEAWLSFNVDR